MRLLADQTPMMLTCVPCRRDKLFLKEKLSLADVGRACQVVELFADDVVICRGEAVGDAHFRSVRIGFLHFPAGTKPLHFNLRSSYTWCQRSRFSA